MRVGLDMRPAFVDPRRGFGRVARELAGALLAEAPGRVVLFVPSGAGLSPEWTGRAHHVVRLRRPRRGAFLADGPAWAWTLRRHPVDVLHLPAWGVPPGIPVPVVATFHDATPFRFPSPPQGWKRHRLRAAARSLRRAALVHAVSHCSAAELAHFAPRAKVPIRVVHWGVGPPFTPAPEPLPPEHLLFVGGAEPHKNLALLLDVLALPESRGLPPLVVAGGAAADPALIRRAAREPLAGRVRLVPDPDDETLVRLYRRALATLVPSLNEGFGLPALEGMACGCPVVAANAGALPEVVGDAGDLLPPDNPGAWLEALRTLLRDPDHRRVLCARAQEHASSLSWSACAKGMWEAYQDASGAS
jgi:glycosyltransferase involved in cell wall biosynthesis